MGIFQQFPYSNFHEMNLDQIIKIMREMQDEWVATKAEWASYKDFIDNYFQNLDVSDEVLAALRTMAASGELITVMDPTIAEEVAEWLAEHVTPTTPAVDNTLSIAGAAADAKAAGDAIDNVLTNLFKFNGLNLCDLMQHNNITHNGVQYTWNPDGSCKLLGTSNAVSWCDLFISANSLPHGIAAGDLLEYIFDGSSRISFVIYDYSGGNVNRTLLDTHADKNVFRVPADCTGMIIRLWVPANTYVDQTVYPALLRNAKDINNASMNLIDFIDEGWSHVDDIDQNCIGFVSTTSGSPSLAGVPYHPCWVETVVTNNNIMMQKIYPYNTNWEPVKIRTKQAGSWTQWVSVSTDGYVEAIDHTLTSDETSVTDMWLPIQLAINEKKYCKLGVGVYYINDQLWLKDGCTLEGCGDATKIVLMSGDGKVAINMANHAALRNLSILGNVTDLQESDFTSTSGTRYGVFFRKGYPSYSTPADWCNMENVSISNFTGSGIYQYETGTNVKQGFFLSNVKVRNCWCGVHIYAESEFCRYSNVQMTYCYIACINNGGNNAFSNCVFHGYSIGMQIIGSRNNSGHGVCANSSFCHTGNNAGMAIKIDDVEHGFVFSALQIWYNSVNISNSSGIVFNGVNFGRGASSGQVINITGGDCIAFNGCMFINDVQYPPAITVSNNSKVKFNNCYGSISGNAITA